MRGKKRKGKRSKIAYKVGGQEVITGPYTSLKVGQRTTPRRSGRFRGVSIGLDKHGYYVMTHRARSKSYASPKSIPLKTLAFIKSTG